MENSAACQLPEVDSLPDGFLDSSTEVDQISTFDKENLRPLCEEGNVSKLEASELLEISDHATEDKSLVNQRNFPDLLAEDFDSFKLTAEAPGESFVEQEGTTPCVAKSGVFAHKSIVMVDGGLSAELSGCQEQAEVKCGTSENSITGVLDSQPTHLKKNFACESAGTPMKKRIDATDVMGKNVKRTFKSEREFLEFTLNYQNVIVERDSAIAVRDRLESLCRALQRQNKLLTDECKRVSTEGVNLREELSSRFSDIIKDISNKLEAQKDEHFSQMKENETLRNRLKEFCAQYIVSEQQFKQKLQDKSMEAELAELKLQEHEKKVAQQESQLKVYAEQVSLLLETEKNLRSYLAADGEKFKHFQESLDKSNKIFETYKGQIEKMGKSVKELKKENAILKSNSQKSEVSLVKLIGEREVLKKEVEKTSRQKEALESLCRSLQAERKHTNSDTNCEC